MTRVRAAVLLLAGIAGCGGGGNGSGPWRPFTIPNTFDMAALWAFAPNDVWAGGDQILHYDGTAFTQVPTPMPVLISDFWGFAPNDLYAASGSDLLHWDGTAWSLVDFGTAIDPFGLQAVWGTSGGDLWLGDESNGRVFRWDGTTWSTMITQVVQVTDLWGVAGGPVFASGIFGLARWSGGTWTDVGDNVAMDGAGLWGFSADEVWVVGDFSTLARWDGTMWNDTIPTNNDRFNEDHQSVWGLAPDDVWAVGDAGAISHWNGTGWSQVQVGSFPYYPFLSAVHGSSPTDIWVAGRNIDPSKLGGVIFHLEP